MNLNEYTKGWLVGDFYPALVNTKDIEVGVKIYKSGDKESRHIHNFVDEYTVIVSGKVLMNNVSYSNGDIVYIPKETSTDFVCLEDSITLVIKSPSIPSDKVII